MGKRQKQWGRRRLDALRVALGGCCRRCGSINDLEIDCILPTGHYHHTLSTDQRATFYYKQFIVGNLQLLCPSCHSRKTAEDDAFIHDFFYGPAAVD
jgi:5-methylcytosine-specific restriction endonuclease McrA